MYSRMVRPLEMRAIKRPTNGAQLIHQAQYMTVHVVNQALLSRSKANVLKVRSAN